MPPTESAAVFRLDALELGGGAADRLLPAHFAPRIGDLLADHRLEDALPVGGVAPGEAALDAGMAMVRLAVLVRHHAHDLVAAHFGLERAADAAIGAGRHHRMFAALPISIDASSRSASPSGRPARRRRTTRIPSRGTTPPCPARRPSQNRGPAMVSAKVPCTSSQARTQREQTMHFDGS